jgi:hypothetical protein
LFPPTASDYGVLPPPPGSIYIVCGSSSIERNLLFPIGVRDSEGSFICPLFCAKLVQCSAVRPSFYTETPFTATLIMTDIMQLSENFYTLYEENTTDKNKELQIKNLIK